MWKQKLISHLVPAISSSYFCFSYILFSHIYEEFVPPISPDHLLGIKHVLWIISNPAPTFADSCFSELAQSHTTVFVRLSELTS